MKCRGKLSVYKGVMGIRLPSYLRDAMVCHHHPGRRENDGSPCHRRAEPMPHRVGDPVATRSSPGRMPGGRLYLLARPCPHAGPHPPALSVTDAAGPHRVHPSAPPLRPTLQCLGLRSSPPQPPPRPLWSPMHTPLRLRAAPYVRCRAVAWASHLGGRWCGRLQARYPGPPGGLRSVDGATAGMRRARGPPPGAVPRRHGPAPTAGGRPPLAP
jgi:hypothetical protein